ncbi:MAG: SAM-dependent methyltransferase [Alphaproteobacteria bacterium]|nr:SAM-dependent methyltransferase [Alphaproteobacteria bacterium]
MPLAQRIRDSIRVNGPMPVSLYMLMCLHDPEHGYYATRPSFNRDFTTAPETSQVFGELIGLWAAHEWLAMGSPESVRLVELGPGRGVMMYDMLRAARAAPGFADAVRVTMIEASPALRRAQQERLVGRTLEYFPDLEAVPPGPAIIVGNEFLDCLAIRQYVRDGNGWRERAVGLAAGDELVFGLGPAAELPERIIPVGDQVEVAPGLDAIVEIIARRFRKDPGRALFLDYGPDDGSPGDTLRAFRQGAQVDPLTDPGACDLTADVDFPRLRQIGLREGLAVHGALRQGHFLSRLGVWERAKRLGAANPARASEITAGVSTLTAPEEMGARFKAICFAPQGAPAPAGFQGSAP